MPVLANVDPHHARRTHLWVRGGIAAMLVVVGVTGVVGARSYREPQADGAALETVVLRSIERVAEAVVPPGVR